MNEEEILALFNSLNSEYELGTIDEFKSYLSDEGNRLSFYNEVIQPQYDVQSLEDFEEFYGLKKKTLPMVLLKKQYRFPIWKRLLRILY